MNDYVVMIDETGQPYIAHAVAKRDSKTHKYIMKVGEGIKARYFYTQAEVKAYLQRGRQVAKNTGEKAKATVDKVTGADKKRERDATQKRAETVKKLYTPLAKSGIKTISDSFKEKNQKKSDELFNKGITMRNLAWNTMDDANAKARKAQEEYSKTPLGVAEKAGEKIKSLADDVDLAAWKAGKKVKSAAENVKNKVDQAAFDVAYDTKRAAKNATDSVKSAYDRMRDEFRKNKEKKSDNSEIKENIITENVIPETRIEERKIIEIEPSKKLISKKEYKKLQKKAEINGIDSLTEDEITQMRLYKFINGAKG